MRSIYDHVPVPVTRLPMSDNAASAVVIDEMGNHAGTFKDAAGDPNTDAHAAVGGALDFDGTDDYVEIADHADFVPVSTPFSISGGMNPNDSGDCPLAVKGTTFPNMQWKFGLYDDDYIYFMLVDKDAVAWIGRTAQISASPHGDEDFYDWLGRLHIVGTYDGGTSIKIYVNGVRVDETQYNFGAFAAVDSGLGYPVWIGREHTEYANARIDNVLFHNRELTAREAMKLADPQGKESAYGPRPNRLYHTNLNNGIFGGVKRCIV